MNIQLKTKVDGNYKDVMRQFDRKLFEALKPSIGEMEIVEFTGSKKGDKVHIRFHSPIKAEWISLITDHGADDTIVSWLMYPAIYMGFYPRKNIYQSYFSLNK